MNRGRANASAETEARTGAMAPRASERHVERPSPGPFLPLLVVVVVLNLLGLVMVLSASSVDAFTEYGSSWYLFQRQLLWLVLGAAVLFVAARVDYRIWRRFTTPLLVAAVALLVAVLIPGVGIEVNGSSRWIGWGQMRIQPSEIAKLAVLLFVADLLARRAHRIQDTRTTLRPVLVVVAVVGGLIMLQPNLGTTAIMAIIALVVLFVAGAPMKPLALVAGVVGALAGLMAFLEPYRYRRLMAFADPWQDPLSTGYQTIQAQVGVANGGLVGVGLGEGRSKWGFLPEPHTDFIFAIVAEEMGLIGALAVVGLFVAFGILGVRVALGAPDRFGMLVAAGATAWILVQAFVNLGAVVGILPITGVPLPFVSFGGSSLLVLMAASGLLLSVARRSKAAAAPRPQHPQRADV